MTKHKATVTLMPTQQGTFESWMIPLNAYTHLYCNITLKLFSDLFPSTTTLSFVKVCKQYIQLNVPCHYPPCRCVSLPGLLLCRLSEGCVCSAWLENWKYRGLFHNTIPSVRHLSLVVMMWLAVVLLCASFGTSASLPLHLTSYPQSAVDGAGFTLSCTTTQSGGFINVIWYRNNVEMFSTSSDADVSTSILNPATTSIDSRAVAGRVTVSSSLQQHNVILRINSTLDQGSVWKCQSGSRFSNNVAVEITDNSEASATIRLTSYPQSAVDGAEFTLSCTSTQSGGLITVIWHRNNVEIFQTNSDADVSTSILNTTTTSNESRAVTERVTVSSSLKQHNVILRINSTLDQGSVWKCRSGIRYSNNVTVDITNKTEGFSTTVPTTPAPIKREITYAVTGSVGGVVVVVVIITVVLLCTLYRRRENAKEEKHGKEGRFNEDSKRETVVMEDNDVYHGFVKAESQKPAEKQQVPDVYSKVNKVKKTNNATEVQITLSIEDLYAKPIKPANGRSESSS
ncbi:uncharacterized protein LOC124255912 isoform X2 [Haliotis rubra]|uniref:uncharacterized protein LOC124255912 isoform X2 n=1 Tax=Haliotis rubra TaxID=36100 RepID=UPI001EE5E6A1|nr:uncharacterized protein LOC124255912 isoform X2 [Haliotis rubra]